jgi:hypothetical protein
VDNHTPPVWPPVWRIPDPPQKGYAPWPGGLLRLPPPRSSHALLRSRPSRRRLRLSKVWSQSKLKPGCHSLAFKYARPQNERTLPGRKERIREKREKTSCFLGCMKSRPFSHAPQPQGFSSERDWKPATRQPQARDRASPRQDRPPRLLPTCAHRREHSRRDQWGVCQRCG